MAETTWQLAKIIHVLPGDPPAMLGKALWVKNMKPEKTCPCEDDRCPFRMVESSLLNADGSPAMVFNVCVERVGEFQREEPLRISVAEWLSLERIKLPKDNGK